MLALVVLGGSTAASAQQNDPVPSVSIVKEVCTTGASCDPTAAIGAAGWAKSAQVAPGAAITWRITVVNDGTDELLGVSVDDIDVNACDRAEAQVPELARMAIGASTTFTCASAGVSQSFTNHANVEAVGCTCGQHVSAADTASVTVTTGTTTTTAPGATTTTTVPVTTTTQPTKVEGVTTTLTPPAVSGTNTTPPAAQGQPLAITGQSIISQLSIAVTLLIIGASALASIRRRREARA
jgi:hypothetical protein